MAAQPLIVNKRVATTTAITAYPTSTFSTRLKDFINAKNTGITYNSLLYGLIANKMDTDALTTTWSAVIDEMVTKAHKYGYDLTTVLSMQNIFDTMAIVPPSDKPKEYVDREYPSMISRITDYLNAESAKIIPKADYNGIDASVDAKFAAKLHDYGIDTVPTTGLLAETITKTKELIKKQFEEYQGAPQGTYFFDKVGFNYDSEIDNALRSPEVNKIITETIEGMIIKIIWSHPIKAGVDSRDYWETIYNWHLNKKKEITFDEFANKFFEPGLIAKLNKFTAAGHIKFGHISLNVDPDTSSRLTIKFKVGLFVDNTSDTPSLEIHRDIILAKHSYAIEAMKEALDFDTQRKKWVFNKDASWTDGQVLTKADILANAIAGGDNIDWNLVFTHLDRIIADKTVGTKVPSYQITYHANDHTLWFKFIDPTILDTDFDSGLDNPAMSEYWFDRTTTYSQVPAGVSQTHRQGFTPRYIIDPHHRILMKSILDDLLQKLTDATKHSGDLAWDKQPHLLPVEELRNPDGTFKAVDLTLLEKVFPGFTDNFDTPLKSNTGYSWTATTTSIEHSSEGVAAVNVVISDGSGHFVSKEIYIKTIDKSLFLKDLIDKISKYENTWEDRTPSVQPMDFTDPLDTSQPFADGQTPSIDQLNSIFNGISSLNQPGVVTITPQANTAVTKPSQLTSDMLISWNNDLIAKLGASADDLKSSLDGILAAVSIFGYSKTSKYIMANVNVDHDGTTNTASMIAVHYLSHEQRIIETQIIEMALGLLVKEQFDKAFSKFDLPQSVRDEIMKKFNEQKDIVLNNIKNILKSNDPNALVPDWEMRNVNNELNNLSNLVDSLKDEYKISDDNLDRLKNASKIFKYILSSIGGILGLTGLVGLLIPIRTSLANKKYRKQNPEVKRSSKGLIAVSAIAGILSVLASTGIMLYVFVVQGGF